MTTIFPTREPVAQTVPRRTRLHESVATAVLIMWLSTTLISVCAPDMVTGSAHEHLPIAALTVWMWALVATAYTLMSVRGTRATANLVLSVSGVWVAAAIAAVGSPEMVTGSDPTRIPIAALVVPIVAAIATGFLGIHHATTSRDT